MVVAPGNKVVSFEVTTGDAIELGLTIFESIVVLFMPVTDDSVVVLTLLVDLLVDTTSSSPKNPISQSVVVF